MAPVGALEGDLRHLPSDDAGGARPGELELFGAERIRDGDEPVPVEDGSRPVDLRGTEDLDIEHEDNPFSGSRAPVRGRGSPQSWPI